MKIKTQANSLPSDPRQTAFINAYYEPNSGTFSNAYQSALSVGYSHSTAKDILYNRPNWFRENQGDDEAGRKDLLLLRLSEIIEKRDIAVRDRIKAIELLMKHYGMLANKPTVYQEFNIQNVLD